MVISFQESKLPLSDLMTGALTLESFIPPKNLFGLQNVDGLKSSCASEDQYG